MEPNFSAAGCALPKMPLMKDDATSGLKPGFFFRAVQVYEKQTDQSLIVWAVLALCNLATQAIFFHEITSSPLRGQSDGEFGILNSALGILGLMTIPLLAVHQAFHLYPSRPGIPGPDARLDSIRASAVTVVETLAWIWGSVCFLLIFLPFPLPYLPRFSLQLVTLINVLLALGGIVSWTVCQGARQFRLWTILLIGAALIRVFVGGGLTAFEPWADSGLAAFLVAGFITLTPALRPRDTDWSARLKAFHAVWDRDFLLFVGATFSVLLGIYLFTNADRIVAISWMDLLSGRFLSSVGVQKGFDYYQASGLLARSLLWGTQPLLWILFAQRSRLDRTTPESLLFFWIYLGALSVGALTLGCLTAKSGLLNTLIPLSSAYGPTFAIVMIPLGLLQGLGIFSLASRRYPECFVLGACSIGYTVVLLWCGRRPEIILPYMFGGSIIALMIVLFVGVTRWGRKQP
jgi:hypothetical protein